MNEHSASGAEISPSSSFSPSGEIFKIPAILQTKLSALYSKIGEGDDDDSPVSNSQVFIERVIEIINRYYRQVSISELLSCGGFAHLGKDEFIMYVRELKRALDGIKAGLSERDMLHKIDTLFVLNNILSYLTTEKTEQNGKTDSQFASLGESKTQFPVEEKKRKGSSSLPIRHFPFHSSFPPPSGHQKPYQGLSDKTVEDLQEALGKVVFNSEEREKISGWLRGIRQKIRQDKDRQKNQVAEYEATSFSKLVQLIGERYLPSEIGLKRLWSRVVRLVESGVLNKKLSRSAMRMLKPYFVDGRKTLRYRVSDNEMLGIINHAMSEKFTPEQLMIVKQYDNGKHEDLHHLVKNILNFCSPSMKGYLLLAAVWRVLDAENLPLFIEGGEMSPINRVEME